MSHRPSAQAFLRIELVSAFNFPPWSGSVAINALFSISSPWTLVRPIIGRVGVGLGNRSSSPVYDISTPQKLKDALLGADTFVFNNVASGNTFAKALEKLGIAESLKPEIVRTLPNGIFDKVNKSKESLRKGKGRFRG